MNEYDETIYLRLCRRCQRRFSRLAIINDEATRVSRLWESSHRLFDRIVKDALTMKNVEVLLDQANGYHLRLAALATERVKLQAKMARCWRCKRRRRRHQ